jgi:hypothetical protein
MAKNYEKLEQDVEFARSNLNVFEQKITTQRSDVLDLLSGKPVHVLNCKNVFSKIKAGAGSTIEDGLVTVNCECFDESEGCVNRKCPRYSDVLEYMAAYERLLKAESVLTNCGKSVGE